MSELRLVRGGEVFISLKEVEAMINEELEEYKQTQWNVPNTSNTMVFANELKQKLRRKS